MGKWEAKPSEAVELQLQNMIGYLGAFTTIPCMPYGNAKRNNI